MYLWLFPLLFVVFCPKPFYCFWSLNVGLLVLLVGKTVCDPLFWCYSGWNMEYYGHIFWSAIFCCGLWARTINFIYGLYENWWAELLYGPIHKWAVGCAADITIHVTYHCHVSNHDIIIAIHIIAMSSATSFSVLLICDMAIESVTLIFVIKNGFGLGLGWASGVQDYFMTDSKRHGSSNSWRIFKEHHEVWSVTLNTWRYLRSS